MTAKKASAAFQSAALLTVTPAGGATLRPATGCLNPATPTPKGVSVIFVDHIADGQL